jgi:opacity protein-like surface antigen
MKRLALLIAAFLALTASAPAQTRYRFELYGSANIPMDKDFEIAAPQSLIPLPGEQQFSPGVRGGLRVGADGLDHWGEDFSYSYGTNASTLAYPGGGFSFTSRSHQFAYNVLFYPAGFKSHKVYPYVTAGVGATIFTVSEKTKNEAMMRGLGEMESHTSFTFNAGGGLRFQLSDHYGLRLDARDWMSHPARYGIPEASDNPLAPVLPVKGVFHQVELSIAFVYRY